MKTPVIAVAALFLAQAASAACGPFQSSDRLSPRERLIGSLDLGEDHCLVPDPKAAAGDAVAERAKIEAFRKAAHRKMTAMRPTLLHGRTQLPATSGLVGLVEKALTDLRAQLSMEQPGPLYSDAALTFALDGALSDLIDHARAVKIDVRLGEHIRNREMLRHGPGIWQ